MKTVVNVYKDDAFWIKGPPGLGDYLRGCFYLEEKARTVAPEKRFTVRFNLDLSPASQYLDYSAVHFPAEPHVLAAAPEYFDPDRDGDVDTVIDDFLSSDQDALLISTNRSWRGVDEIHTSPSINQVAHIVNFTPVFNALMRGKMAGVPKPFALLHIRDVNLEATKHQPAKYRRWSWDSLAYSRRVKRFIGTIVGAQAPAGCAIVCISNNVRLRDHLCKKYGYFNMGTEVRNTGNRGVLSEAELLDAALIKNARMVFSLSYYPWNSGFVVWLCRLYGVPSILFNARSEIG